MSKKVFVLLYTLILVLALGLRLWQLGKIPLSTYWDETAILADAKKVVLTDTDLHNLSPWHLIYPSYGDYKLAPYIWTVIISTKFFGFNAFALRLPSVIAGCLTIIIAGLLARNLAPIKKQAKIWQLSSMLVIAIIPWSILFSRTAFEGHLGQMFLSLAVLLLVYGWQKLPPRLSPLAKFLPASLFFLASGLIGGLAFWTYFSVRFVWPGVFLLIIAYFGWQKKSWRSLILALTILLTTFALMFLVMARTPFYSESNRFRLGTNSILNNPELPHLVNAQRQLAGNNLLARFLFTQKITQLTQLLENYSAHLDFSYLFLTGDSNLRHSTGFNGLFYLILAPFLLWGIIALWIKKPFLALIFLTWWLLGLLPASVPTTGVPHALRTLNSLVPSCLLISFGLIQIFDLSPLWKKISLSFVGLFLTLGLSRFVWYYFTVYPTASASDWQTANLELAHLLALEKSNFDQLYVFGLDQLLYLWYLLEPTTDLSSLGVQILSRDFKFENFDQLHFNQLPALPLSGPTFILGEKSSLLNFLNQHQSTYQILYDYEQFGQSVLGVSLSP